MGECASQVRVVDKRVRGGRLYLKKGTIVDVHPAGLCDIAMDEGKEMVQVGGRGAVWMTRCRHTLIAIR
jgi:hypothetical protein